jgi:hypothetical protein
MYYSIENQTNTKEVGPDYPQANCLTQPYAHEIKFNSFPNFEPKLIYELSKRAKLTDVLSQAAISAHGLLVGERFKIILQGFNLMKHKFYPVTIQTKKGIEQYYWLHLVDSSFINVINYNASKFYWTKSTFRKDVIKLTSFDEYQKLKKENGILWGVSIDEIKLNESFDSNLDLFSSIPFDMGIYVSDRLKKKIEEEKITGIQINEATNFI